MYLRTTKRKNKDGSTVAYYQLAHNIWDSEKGRSKVEILYNFGRADELEREALVRLCRSIAKVCGVEVRDPLRGETTDRPLDVEMVRARGLGVPHIAKVLWERLGIQAAVRKQIAEAGASPELETALLAMVANRLDAPTSKLGVWERWLDTVFMPEARELSLGRMYEALDFLHDHHQAIEESVFFHTANLFNLEVDVIFYDTTTAEFALDEGDDGLRRFGHSKDGRWTPQVVIALAVTREGLPVRSWVFPGNTSDVTTIETIRADLRGWKLGRTLFVGDAGMNSEENRRHLTRGGGRYVLACGVSSTKEVLHDVLKRPGRFKKIAENLHVKEVVVGEGELRRRYLVCRNPQQAERERLHREQVVRELEEELARHRDNSVDPKWAAKLRASGRYGRWLRVRNRKLEIDRKKVREAARHDGKWVLITNDDTLSPTDAADAYKALLVIERCFRTMKSVQIEVRPMFHRLDHRIVAHVKVCVLALLLTRVAERATGKAWSRVHDDLQTLQAIEYETPTHRFFQRTRPSRELTRVFSSLEITLPKQVLATAPREEQLTAA